MWHTSRRNVSPSGCTPDRVTTYLKGRQTKQRYVD
ncbi:hypothetical protein FAES_5201 [Fibrella aestuarina BUZ 2]|uniref:Uncharacterized protein n=1 Tax=Fibrella aestuarina BUZ 2 TaxID=1166018 RepID=I0KGE7_9BACT|nr:hypothetical protein FAES_5201 [Fibrella aestuarina BUZ 2]